MSGAPPTAPDPRPTRTSPPEWDFRGNGLEPGDPGGGLIGQPHPFVWCGGQALANPGPRGTIWTLRELAARSGPQGGARTACDFGLETLRPTIWTAGQQCPSGDQVFLAGGNPMGSARHSYALSIITHKMISRFLVLNTLEKLRDWMNFHSPALNCGEMFWIAHDALLSAC